MTVAARIASWTGMKICGAHEPIRAATVMERFRETDLTSPEHHHSHRRQCDRDAVFPVALRRGPRRHTAPISYITPAEVLRIGVEDLNVESRRGDADLVLLPHDGGEVAAHK